MRHKLIDLYQFEDYYTYKKYNEIYQIGTKRSTNKIYLKCLMECMKIALEKEITGIQKEMIEDYYYKEKSMREIAEKYNITVSVVSRHIKKGKEKIGAKLEYFEGIYKIVFNELTRDEYL